MKLGLRGFQESNHISKSVSTYRYIWFIKYPFALYAKFKPQKPSISFFAGTKVHGYFQKIIQKKWILKDVQEDFNRSLIEIDLSP